MTINVLDVVSLILIALAIDPEAFFSASIVPIATDPPNMWCSGCMLRIDREIWFYEGEPGVRLPGNIRTVADRNSNRTSTSYQLGAYSNPQTEVRARTPRTIVAESRARRARRRNQLTPTPTNRGFVDWSGERVRCPNLQRAHGGYLCDGFFHSLTAASGTLIPPSADRYILANCSRGIWNHRFLRKKHWIV